MVGVCGADRGPSGHAVRGSVVIKGSSIPFVGMFVKPLVFPIHPPAWCTGCPAMEGRTICYAELCLFVVPESHDCRFESLTQIMLLGL